MLLCDFPAADVGAIWCSVTLTLDADAGELWASVGGGQPAPAPLRKALVFTNLPKGRTFYPCLSMCNAGQVVFRKDASE